MTQRVRIVAQVSERDSQPFAQLRIAGAIREHPAIKRERLVRATQVVEQLGRLDEDVERRRLMQRVVAPHQVELHRERIGRPAQPAQRLDPAEHIALVAGVLGQQRVIDGQRFRRPLEPDQALAAQVPADRIARSLPDQLVRESQRRGEVVVRDGHVDVMPVAIGGLEPRAG